MKTRVLGILLLLTALLTACVYDFTPDYNGEGGLMVIEGDILIGEVCQFNFAYS